MMSMAHVVDDLYQGIVPALLPFLVIERQYSYAAVAGLTLAATVLSSVVQPLFGWWSDRKPRRWLIPTGMATAALGVGFAGVFPSYAATWFVIAVSGLGIAAFHPSAASAARRAASASGTVHAITSPPIRWTSRTSSGSMVRHSCQSAPAPASPATTSGRS